MKITKDQGSPETILDVGIPQTDSQILDAIREIAAAQVQAEIKTAIENDHAVKMVVLQPDQRTACPEIPKPTQEQIDARAATIHDKLTPGELHLVWAGATHRGALHHTAFSWGKFGNQWFSAGVRAHTS